MLVSEPLVAVVVTVYVPGDEKVWFALIPVAVLFAPETGSPKSQTTVSTVLFKVNIVLSEKQVFVYVTLSMLKYDCIKFGNKEEDCLSINLSLSNPKKIPSET